MSSPTLSDLTLTSTSDVYQDSNGLLFRLHRVANPLASDRVSFLTTLKHPFLLKYYHLSDQQNGEIAEEYCPLGSLCSLLQAQHPFSPNDVWGILTQLLHVFQYLSEKEFLVHSLSPLNIFVCSLDPIRIKFSLFSPTQSQANDLFSVDIVHQSSKDVSIRVKCYYERVLKEFSQLLFRTIRKYICVNSHSTPKVLSEWKEVKDDDFRYLSSKHFRVCEFYTNHLSALFSPKPITITKQICFSDTVLFHVLTQKILKFKKPLLKFQIDKEQCFIPNSDFKAYANGISNLSINFRKVFLDAFDLCCKNAGNALNDDYDKSQNHPYIVSTDISYTSMSNMNSTVPWCFTKFPPTAVSTKYFYFSQSSHHLPCLSNVSMLELSSVDGLLPMTFPNVSSIFLHLDGSQRSTYPSRPCTNDLCLLSQYFKLHTLVLKMTKSVQLDFSSISKLSQLTSLTLQGFFCYDLRPLQQLTNLTYLDLRKAPVSREFRTVLLGRRAIMEVVNSFDNVTVLDLSDSFLEFAIDVKKFSSCDAFLNLKVLKLRRARILNYDFVGVFSQLEELDLSYAFLADEHDPFTDISSLSELTNLKSLYLDGIKVSDISYLEFLEELSRLSLFKCPVHDLGALQNLSKLSELDVRNTAIPARLQGFLSGISEVRDVVSFFVRSDVDSSNTCRKEKLLNLIVS
ncbi:hypothetical protein RCL1_008301 [Eukaryota sp. TZLM3-RCL]